MRHFLGEAVRTVPDYCTFIIIISCSRLAETAVTVLWTHPTERCWLQNIFRTWRPFGSLLCNKALCWPKWAWKLSIILATVQTLLPGTFDCSPSWRWTLEVVILKKMKEPCDKDPGHLLFGWLPRESSEAPWQGHWSQRIRLWRNFWTSLKLVNVSTEKVFWNEIRIIHTNIFLKKEIERDKNTY